MYIVSSGATTQKNSKPIVKKISKLKYYAGNVHLMEKKAAKEE